MRLEGAVYSVPCRWAGLDLIARLGATMVTIVGRDGTRILHPRKRFGQRSIDYRHYLPELARKPQAVRQVLPELLRDLGAPFPAVWDHFHAAHAPREPLGSLPRCSASSTCTALPSSSPPWRSRSAAGRRCSSRSRPGPARRRGSRPTSSPPPCAISRCRVAAPPITTAGSRRPYERGHPHPRSGRSPTRARLKLPGVARVFESVARQARDAHWPHEDYLQEVLSAELASRHESVIRQRLREARFPEVKTLDTFDFTAVEGVSATQIHTLARGEWVTAPENLIFAGPIGTGKTHLAIALGVEATKQKRRVLFTRAADLVRQLLEARDARELTRLQQRLLRVDVLVIDELGFVPFERVGGELLFNLITDRYERRATVVTTNLAFAEWVTVFAGDEKLTTALLDRLAHHATVITTKGKSYRMRKRRAVAS